MRSKANILKRLADLKDSTIQDHATEQTTVQMGQRRWRLLNPHPFQKSHRCRCLDVDDKNPSRIVHALRTRTRQIQNAECGKI
jgi:hypothetical protein